jgi:hypothetical protein
MKKQDFQISFGQGEVKTVLPIVIFLSKHFNDGLANLN